MAATLTRWPLLASLLVLLLNDFWLKSVWPGVITGKLSDFAGIALVTLLLLAVAPRNRWSVFAAIATGFTYWKSPLSQPLIQWLNDGLPWQVGRVVDYTDLIALSIMPLCARAADRGTSRAPSHPALRRWLLPPVVLLTSLGLIATPASLIRHNYGLTPIASSRIEPGSVAAIIREVATRQGLKCEECAAPTQSAVYVSRHLRLSYQLDGQPRVDIRILKGAGGMFVLSDKGARKADALRVELHAYLKASNVNMAPMEYGPGTPLTEQESPALR